MTVRIARSIIITSLLFMAGLHSARAQVFVGGQSEPTVEVDFSALNGLPHNGSHKAVRLHEPQTFRDNSDDVVQYDSDDGESYEYQDVPAFARQPVSRRVIGSNASSSSDNAQNLNRLQIQCADQNATLVPVSQTNVSQISAPMAPPIISAGSASIPAPIPLTTPATPSASALEAGRPATPAPVGIPSSAPQITAEPIPPPSTYQVASTLPMAPPTAPAMATQAGIVPPPSQTASGALTPDDLRIDFKASADAVPVNETPRLDRLVAKMAGNPDLRVELRSFASGGGTDMAGKARRVSLARALAVRSYLTDHGIAADRIDVRALGAPPDQNPGDRVDMFLTR